MIAASEDLDSLVKRLSLANTRRVWRDLVARAGREAWSYHDFLTRLATEEIAKLCPPTLCTFSCELSSR